MLVLSRKVDEEIVIDRHIRVRLLQAGHGRVRLGIDAPREVDVRRAELGFEADTGGGEKMWPRVAHEGTRTNWS